MKTLKASWPVTLSLFLAGLFFLADARGQDATLEILGGDAKTVKVKNYVVTLIDAVVVSKLPFTIKAPAMGVDYEWTYPDTLKARSRRNVLEVKDAVKGETSISVDYVIQSIVGGEIKQTPKSATLVFFVGEVVPPVPPAPPTPPVPPAPPAPPVNPAPISEPGLRVLIIYEIDAGPPGLNLIVSGEKVRNYMVEKGVKGGFLAIDKDITDEELTRVDPWVREAYKRPREAYKRPWLIVGNGTTGFEGPLPVTNAPTDALNLIKKYGD